jgi:hypothetical protein
VKKIFFYFFALLIIPVFAKGQELQLHYDFRHTVDPSLYEKNFPWLDFKYFKDIDTIGTGSFLMEAQTFLNGNKNNIGQSFFQLSQSLKFWKPNIYSYFYYSGGLGVTPSSFGYYISNAYAIGVSYPLIFKNTWLNFSILYRYSALQKISQDPQFNFYIGGALFNYKLKYSSTLVLWSTNNDDGMPANTGKNGKKVLFFADPQIWYSLVKKFSLGSRVSVYYNLIGDKEEIVFYPTIGIKRDF